MPFFTYSFTWVQAGEEHPTVRIETAAQRKFIDSEEGVRLFDAVLDARTASEKLAQMIVLDKALQRVYDTEPKPIHLATSAFGGH